MSCRVRRGRGLLTGEKDRKANGVINHSIFLSGPLEVMTISLLVPWISLLVKKDQVDESIMKKLTK